MCPQVWFMEIFKKQAHEYDEPRPKEIYGTMKLAGEEIVKGFSRFLNLYYH